MLYSFLFLLFCFLVAGFLTQTRLGRLLLFPFKVLVAPILIPLGLIVLICRKLSK